MCAVELVCDICAWNWNNVILLQRFLYRLWVRRPDVKMILFSAIVERASESDLLRQLLGAYNKDHSALHFKRHLLKSTTNFIDASKKAKPLDRTRQVWQTDLPILVGCPRDSGFLSQRHKGGPPLSCSGVHMSCGGCQWSTKKTIKNVGLISVTKGIL
jgi:hypothetical protein